MVGIVYSIFFTLTLGTFNFLLTGYFFIISLCFHFIFSICAIISVQLVPDFLVGFTFSLFFTSLAHFIYLASHSLVGFTFFMAHWLIFFNFVFKFGFNFYLAPDLLSASSRACLLASWLGWPNLLSASDNICQFVVSWSIYW